MDKVRFVLKWTIYLGVQPAKGILNIRHPIKLWTRMKEDYLRAAMNKGVKDEDKMTSRPATRPDQRYPDLMESMFKMWQRFNVAQARWVSSLANSSSMRPLEKPLTLPLGGGSPLSTRHLCTLPIETLISSCLRTELSSGKCSRHMPRHVSYG